MDSRWLMVKVFLLILTLRIVSVYCLWLGVNVNEVRLEMTGRGVIIGSSDNIGD